ncbi:hypothetical protein V8C37DRAFT_395401 [Trichoderma ceciliae]
MMLHQPSSRRNDLEIISPSCRTNPLLASILASSLEINLTPPPPLLQYYLFFASVCYATMMYTILLLQLFLCSWDELFRVLFLFPFCAPLVIHHHCTTYYCRLLISFCCTWEAGPHWKAARVFGFIF